ncbi:hypothetical protein WCP94_001009 [Bilophila wadsworthia]
MNQGQDGLLIPKNFHENLKRAASLASCAPLPSFPFQTLREFVGKTLFCWGGAGGIRLNGDSRRIPNTVGGISKV